MAALVRITGAVGRRRGGIGLRFAVVRGWRWTGMAVHWVALPWLCCRRASAFGGWLSLAVDYLDFDVSEGLCSVGEFMVCCEEVGLGSAAVLFVFLYAEQLVSVLSVCFGF